MTVISRHRSRREAREAVTTKQTVVRLGTFANGSFGLYAPVKQNGQYINGPNPLITVWAVVQK